MAKFLDALGTTLSSFKIGSRLLSGVKSLIFDNGFTTTVTANPTADRDVTIKDESGTLSLMSDVKLFVTPSVSSQPPTTNGVQLNFDNKYNNYLYPNTFSFRENTHVPGSNGAFAYHFASGDIQKNILFSFAKTGVNTCFFAQDGNNFFLMNERTNGAFIFKLGFPFFNDGNLGANGAEVFRITPNSLEIKNTKVLGERITGWTASTGVSNRGAFDTETATLLECARRIRSLENDLRTHGLIN